MPATFTDEFSFRPLWLAAGTLVATSRGEMPVEDMQPGLQVLTRAAGLIRVRAVGAAVERTRGDCAQAVLLPAGSLGQGLPEQDLTVLGDQRVLVFGDLAQDGEGFAAAAGLGIAREAPERPVIRLDLAIRGPVAVLANGAWIGSEASVLRKDRSVTSIVATLSA